MMENLILAVSLASAAAGMVILVVEGLLSLSMGDFNSPRKYKKGHVREYDPTGQYVYKDQNPTFRR